MKPVHKMDSTSQSCSCTSCLYKSESDRPSIRKYIKHGSGIDRLYYGKYIPLRERKLLNKLVRTRAVYDDLRARLISDSTLSLEKNADLTPGKHHKLIKTPDSKQSGAVLELVDLIDKGGALESNDLSECCSCCSCTSKSKVLERGKKEHRRKRAFAQTYEPKPVIEEGIYARAYEREDGKTVSGRISERYNKRTVRFKPKRIKSEPCTCTLKFSSLIKKHSEIQQDMVEKPKRQSFARKSLNKYLKLQEKLHQDIRKLNESRTNLTRNLQVRTKKSLEKFKNKVQSGIRKSVQKMKSLHPKEKAFNFPEYPETTFKIKKDSIVKYKDYLKKKNKMKDWECDLGCEPNICVPDDCFKIIKLRKLHKYNRQNNSVKVGKSQLSKSNSSVQTNRFSVTIPKHKPRMRNLNTSRSSQTGIHLHAPKHKHRKVYQRHNKSHIASNSTVASSQVTNENLRTKLPIYEIKPLSSLNKKTILGTNDKNMSKDFDRNRRTSQVSLTPARLGTLTPMISERNSYNKQAVRIESTFSLNIEFSKKNDQNGLSNEPSAMKEVVKQTPSKNRPGRKAYTQAKTTLRKCFCTFKLQAIRSKKKSKTGTEILSLETSKPVRSMTDRYVETKNNNIYKMPKLYNLSPYQCEPGVCVPGECDPILCKNIIDLRNRRRINKSIGSNTASHKTKSTGSILSKHFKSPKAKLVQSSITPTKSGKITPSRRYKDNLNMGRGDLIKARTNAPERQALRIGSNISFNIEFYKEKNLDVMPDKETLFGKTQKYYQKRQKDIDKSEGSVKKLKQRKKHTAQSQTLREASIEEWNVNRGTKTKKEHRYKLLPFECKPYFCVPGKCDPYICLQKIKSQDMNIRNISTFTEKPEMRSISSFTERSIKKSKAVLAHRKKFQKGRSMNVDYFKPESKPSKVKQAVRIGSNFSFSIEFSKQQPGTVTLSKPRKKKQSSKYDSKMKNGKDITITKVRVSHDSTQASTPKIPKVNRASFVRPLLKRCFCTLNLQKRTKHHHRKDLTQEHKYFAPNDYTVYRATNTKTNFISTFGSHINTNFHVSRPESEIISISTSSSLFDKHINSLESTYETVNHYSTFKLPIQSKRPIIIKSNLSMKVDVIRQLKDSQILKSSCCLSLDEKFHECSQLSINQKHNQSYKKLTSFNRFLEKCFCTMNVQVSNKGDALKAKKISNELKAYECEPGICIPGECDPYECKKLIMRRLTKHVQNSSGTIVNNKPLSSLATTYSQIDPGGFEKQTKRRKKLKVHQRLHKEYKPLRKYHSQPFEKYDGYNDTNTQIQKPVPSIGTSVHRGHTNRRFCSLKLRKNSIIPTEYIIEEETNSLFKNSLNGSTYKSVSISTQGSKTHVKNRRLQSASLKQKYKKRAVEAISVRKNHKATKPMTCIKSKKNFNSHIAGTTSSRQAVYINSNFSFNIEFSKNIPQVKQYQDTNLRRVKTPSNDSKSSKDRKEVQTIYSPTTKDRKEIKTIYSPSTKSFSYKVTEPEKQLIQRPKTVTSYIERSLNNIPDQRSKQTLRHKCLCLLGLRSKGQKDDQITRKSDSQIKTNRDYQPAKKLGELRRMKKNKQPVTKPVQTSDKLTYTNYKSKPYLEPYECEPRICDPDHCNPYLCQKEIQQRTIKQDSRKLENEPLRTQSPYGRCGRGSKRFKNEETSKRCTLPSYKVETKIKRKTFKVSILKRCLCTLKLKKKQYYEIEKNKTVMHLETKPMITMKSVRPHSNTRFKRQLLTDLTVHSRSAIEQQSLQRIKRSHQLSKESGTINKYPKNKSFGTDSKIDTIKDENLQVQTPITITKKTVHNLRNFNKTRLVDSCDKQRQAVRIGSNFSFNIEVFKEIENDSPKIVTSRAREQPSKNTSQKHIKTQQSGFNCNINSKLISRKQQSADTEMPKCDHSSVRDFFKKCVCAFKRNKVGKQQNKQPAIEYDIEGTSTHRRRIPQSLMKESVRRLHPFECEPYICVPGECNPYECLKHSFYQQQFPDNNTNYKRNVKDFGNVSIKQPVYKSSKVQYEGKRKFNSRTCLTSKCTRLGQISNQFPSLIYPNTKRQTVRIGSNISLNVDFFKGNVIQNIEHNDNKEFKSEELQFKQPENQWAKYKGTTRTVTRRCKEYCPITEAKRQVIRPLSKKINQPKSEGKMLSSTVTKDKTTATKIKYTIPQDMGVYECPPHTCIPGQYNPYEYLDKIKAREYIRKSVNNFRTHKVQSPVPKKRNVIVSTTNSELQSEILKSSRKLQSEPAVFSFRKIEGRDNEGVVVTYTYKNRGDIKLKDHASDTADLQKRSFCTLQLQKPKIARVEMNPGNHVHYSQTFTIGRAVVEPFLNPLTHINPSKKTDVTKATFIHPKLLKRTVGTKVNKNHFRNTIQCDPVACSNFRRKIFGGKTQGDMQTILPSMSRKFNKKQSLMTVSDKNANKSNKRIPSNSLDTKSNVNESIFCQCSRLFSRRSKNRDKPILPGTERQPVGIQLLLAQNNAKKLGKDCPLICPDNNDKPKITFANAIPKRKRNKYINSATRSTRNSPLINDLGYKNAVAYSESADNCNYCKSCKSKFNTDEISKGGGDGRLKRQSPRKAPKDVHNSIKKIPSVKENILIKSQKAKGARQFLRKTPRDFIKSQKAAKGDSQSLRKTPKDLIKAQKAVKGASKSLRKTPKNLIKSQRAEKGTRQFLWKAPKDVNNTRDKVDSAKKNVLIKSQKAAEGAHRALKTFGNFIPATDMLLSVNPMQSRRPRPCICGSKKCKKKLSKEMKSNLPLLLRKKQVCVCGSSICTNVSKKLKKKDERKAVKRQTKPVISHYERKPFKERIQIAKKKDEIRRLERIKRNKKLEKQVQKYKNASDFTLAVESLIDIGKLGGSTLTDALRYSTRAYTDPLVARETICKSGRREKRLCFWKRARNDDALASDIYSTYRRVKTRCSFMDGVRILKRKLEANTFTHFLLHIRDKNAKGHKYRETREIPEKRVRQRSDFQCNVYMATLRKKPFISLYYKYPRLYPHFLALLSIWRQLTNIVFFVLAAVVWSPCILSVELCRSLMCCFFCTG